MNAILHRVEFDADPAQVFRALTETDQLSAWWTRAEELSDNQLCFSFGPNGEHKVTMAVTASEPHRELEWRCQSGPWENTDGFQFEIKNSERGAILFFSNPGWHEDKNNLDFFRHCNTKWGYFLGVSLKQFVETGRGQPHPMDPNI